MLRTLLRMKEPFYIDPSGASPATSENEKRFWSTCFSRARVLLLYAVYRGNC